MKNISSKDNAIYKHLYKVAQAKLKEQALLEGYHLCQMYLTHRGQPERVILQEGVDYNSHEWQALLGRVESNRVLLLSASLFKTLNTVDSPQAIMFLIDVGVNEATPLPTRNSVYLDRLQDPGNMGTILRTCVAVGIQDIYLSKGCVNPWSSKVLRSGQGAHFSLNIYTGIDSTAFLEDNHLPVYITYLDDKAQNLYQTKLPHDVVWVMGNEGRGVSDIFVKKAAQTIYIPQQAGVESLNVGIACALVLYEQWRQGSDCFKH